MPYVRSKNPARESIRPICDWGVKWTRDVFIGENLFPFNTQAAFDMVPYWKFLEVITLSWDCID